MVYSALTCVITTLNKVQCRSQARVLTEYWLRCHFMFKLLTYAQRILMTWCPCSFPFSISADTRLSFCQYARDPMHVTFIDRGMIVGMAAELCSSQQLMLLAIKFTKFLNVQATISRQSDKVMRINNKQYTLGKCRAALASPTNFLPMTTCMHGHDGVLI